MRHFIAGVLAHAPALMAFLNPTINAYRRLVPDSLAPTHANWGWDNRTSVRPHPARARRARRASRSASATAARTRTWRSPRSSPPACTALREELDAGPPVAGDAYRADDPGEPLPTRLDGALDALEADEVLRDALGPEIVDTVPGDEALRDRAPPGVGVRLGARPSTSTTSRTP